MSLKRRPRSLLKYYGFHDIFLTVLKQLYSFYEQSTFALYFAVLSLTSLTVTSSSNLISSKYKKIEMTKQMGLEDQDASFSDHDAPPMYEEVVGDASDTARARGSLDRDRKKQSHLI
jgi:hypothetical protein